MQGEGEDLPPFWLQSSATRRRSSSLFLNSGVLVLLLLVTAILSMFFVIPSIIAHTAHIFRPPSVKKTWDSLNIVLVLLAIVFGFLSRNRNDDDQTHSPINRDLDVPKSNPSTLHQWFQYSDRTVYNSSSVGGLRTSSSYPDLRQVSPWLTQDDRWRFFDDTHVDGYRLSDSDPLPRRRRHQEVEEDHSAGTKNIHVDTFVSRPKEVPFSPLSESPPPRPSPPLPPSLPLPPPVVKQKPRRTNASLEHKGKRNREVKNDLEPKKSIIPPVVPPPPPPPPPPLPSQFYSEQKSRESNRKRGGANVTKDFLTSLYHQKKKKKKQRQKSVDNLESLLQSQPPSLHLQAAPPPLPPPPPPSVFQNPFSSKKGKTKRIILVPPPPPPPPQQLTAARASKDTTHTTLVAARRTPPALVKINSFNSVDDNSNSRGESPLIGNQSPLIPIPPPPPPPPFKMPAWKFAVQGDYVRVRSNNSSRSGSPDLDDVESPSSIESAGTTAAVDSGDAMSPLFCPSPDVDTKADSFIAKFRAGLRLEKMNSIKKKHGLGMSNLGPEQTANRETDPGPGPSRI